MKRKPLTILLINAIALIAAYYVCLLLHEWGHGTAAWLLGQKSCPFDIYYGSWSLLHVDENVDYTTLHATNQGLKAAIIGISGITVTAILFILGLVLISRSSIQKNIITFSFVYWTLAINMVPIVQYLSLMAFSDGGDIGHFNRGLNISPWWIFIFGTFTVIMLVKHMLRVEVPRAYAILRITSLWGRRLFLLTTLSVIFLAIYTHGYNPISDPLTKLPSKILAVISIFLVPILFFICNPSRVWVKIMAQRYSSSL